MAAKTWFGGTGDWDDLLDWSPNGVPGVGDSASINAGTVNLSANDPPIDVGSLSIANGATLAIAEPGQTQTVVGAVSNAGALSLDATGPGGSTLDIDGVLTNTGTGAQGLRIGAAGLTAASSVTLGGLSNTGAIGVLGGSAAATATLTVGGVSLDTGPITMNAFGSLVASGAMNLEGATVTGGTLATSGGGTIGNTGGNSTLLIGVAIATGTTYVDGQNLQLSGVIGDAGVIDVGSAAAATLSIAAAGATLNGGGQVNLFDSASSSISGGALVNAGVTIAGAGEISGLASFDNQAAGIVDADQSTSLFLYYQANATNEGVVEATAAAKLFIDGTTLTQSGAGQVEANGSGAVVELYAGQIVGGTISTSSGGAVESVGGTLTGVAITTGSLVEAIVGDDLTLSGTIDNQGRIDVGNATTNGAISIASGGATLTGGGDVVLSNNANNSIGGGALINTDDTIEGAGTLAGLSLFTNQAAGLVDADDSVTLNVGTTNNQGTMEATKGATLEVDDVKTITQSGAGVMQAVGIGSVVELFAATIVGGAVSTSGGGAIESVNGELNGVTITTGSLVETGPGDGLTLAGTIVNQGQIDVGNATTNGAISIASGGATLTGGGDVVLSNNANNSIGGGVLINTDDTIDGAGTLAGLSLFTNQATGLVDADDSVTLNVGTTNNQGTIEATKGATLEVDDVKTITQSGAGVMQAVGIGSVVELFAATIVGGAVSTSGGGAIESVNGELNGVTITTGSLVETGPGDGLTLAGTIVNQGQIDVGDDMLATNGSLSIASGGATLTGGGDVVFSNNANNSTGGGGALVNTDDTIEGAGSLAGLASFTNQAGGLVDADRSVALNIGSASNLGIMEATHGATLLVDDVKTITQSGAGVMQAVGTGSEVELFAATILGGAVSTSGGGAIHSVNGALNGVTITTGSLVETDPGDGLTLFGAIDNQGQIDVGGVATNGSLIINAAGVTLSGGGDVVLSNDVSNAIGGGGALVNTDDTIEGAGSISGLASFTNQTAGVVDADQSSTPLQISAIPTLLNNGVFEATAGGTLHVFSAVSGSGQFQARAGSEVDLGGATSETVAFSGLNSELKLDTPSNYSGQISGFAVGDTIDLGNTTASAATPTANGLNTTLTIGGTPLAYTLVGDYVGDTFSVTHSGADSLITLTAANAPPVLGNAGNADYYVQAGPAVAVDSALTVSDLADPVVAGATVAISAGFVAGDQLNFTTQGAITGSYSAATGVLALVGAATVSAYETALQSITFDSTSANPTSSGADPTRTITWTATNGAATSAPLTSTIDVIALPALGGAGNSVTYVQAGAAAVIDSGLSVSDFSSTTLSNASVTISGGLLAGDALTFASEAGIAGSYNAGVLTFTGPASLASYAVELDSVAFSSSSGDPASGGADPTRAISWSVSDDAVTSATVTSTINVVDLPEVATAGYAATFDLAGAPVVADPDVTDADPSAQLTGATVSIAGGLQPGDALGFAAQNGVTGSYSNGVLTLTGTASPADYQLALASVTFSTTSLSIAPRTLDWQVNAAAGPSNVAVSTVDIGDIPPTLSGGDSTVGYTQGGAAAIIDSGLAVSDAASATLSDATATIANGLLAGDQLTIGGETSGVIDDGGGSIAFAFSGATLTLSGTDTLADYQAALDAVAFGSSSLNPTNYGSDTARLIAWQVSAGALNSNVESSTVDVIGVDQPPVLGGGGDTVTFTVGEAAVTIDSGLTASDPDSQTLASATVSISSGPQAGDLLSFTAQSGVTGSYNAGSGVLTLTGSASLNAYQAMLDSVVFSTTSGDMTPRGLSFEVSDGTLNSNVATATIDVDALAPVLSGGGAVSYTVGDAAVATDGTLAVADVSSATLTSATVTIANGLRAGDLLSFTAEGGVTGGYDAANGELTLLGLASLSAYQTMLDSVVFSTTDDNMSPRTLSYEVADDALTSNVVTSTIDVTVLAPVLSGGGDTVQYTIGGAAVTADSGLVVSDVSSATLTGATVAISNGLQAGDQLSFAPQAGLSGSYNFATGVLTIVGSASLATYQTALDSVSFSTTSGSGAPRTLSFAVSAGVLTSNVATATVDIAALPPVLSDGGNTTSYVIGAAPVAVDPALAISDSSSTTLTGATVIAASEAGVGGPINQLFAVAQAGITITNNGAGLLTLSGTASLAAYQAALDSVTYSTNIVGFRTNEDIQFRVSDGSLTSNVATTTIDLSAPAGPTLGGGGNTVQWAEAVPPATTATPAVADAGLTVSGAVTGATVAITSGFLAKDTLAFVNQNGIAGSYNATTGVLTLSGAASAAAYQAALESVTFTSTAASPTSAGIDSTRTLSWTAYNGAAASNSVTSAIDLGQTYILTTGTDTINAGVGSDTFVATSPSTLNASDRINGGGGANTLMLDGGAFGVFFNTTYNLNTPAQLSNIQTIDVLGTPTGPTTVDLRSGLNGVSVNVGSPNEPYSSFIINGGNDNDTINLLGSSPSSTGGGGFAPFTYSEVNVGSAAETINVDAPDAAHQEMIINETAATIGATINGNDYTETNALATGVVLDVIGGGRAVMGSNIAGIKAVLIDSPNTDLVANGIAGLVVGDGTVAGGNTLQAGGPNQVLFGTQADTFVNSVASMTTDEINSYTDIINSRIVLKNFLAGDLLSIDLSGVVANASISYTQTTPAYGTLTFSGHGVGFLSPFVLTGHITLDGQFYAPGFSAALQSPGGEENITYAAPSHVNLDGSFDYAYSNVTGEPYSSYENIYNASSVLLASAYNENNGTGSLTLDSGPATFTSTGGAESLTVGADVFSLTDHATQSIAATSLIQFNLGAGFGHDTISGFVATGGAHDTLDFSLSMFNYLNSSMSQAADAAAVLAHVSAGSNPVIADTVGDTLTLSGVTRTALASNLADFKFS